MLGEEGKVVVGQLVLEGLGGGGDDGAPTGEEGRHEVGERLAGARTGLDGEVFGSPDACDDLGHRPGHGLLAGTPLAAVRQVGGDLLEGDRCALGEACRSVVVHVLTVPAANDTGAAFHRAIGASR